MANYNMNDMISHFVDDDEPEKEQNGWNNTKCMANMAGSGHRCDKKAVWRRKLVDYDGHDWMYTCGNQKNWVFGNTSKSPGTSPEKQVK